MYCLFPVWTPSISNVVHIFAANGTKIYHTLFRWRELHNNSISYFVWYQASCTFTQSKQKFKPQAEWENISDNIRRNKKNKTNLK